MEGMTAQKTGVPSILDGYAQQGRMFLFNAAQNLIQFGRVLTEAKPLVPHGQFVDWVKENFDIGKSTAENYMSVWKRFGQSDQFSNVQYSKLRAMLSLPEGSEEAFAESNDLDAMTSSEVQKAVERVRAEEKRKFDAEHDARIALEGEIAELRNREIEIPQDIMDKLADISRYEEIASDAVESRNEINAQLTKTKNELKDANELLQQQQEEYNAVQSELLEMKSAAAKGDIDRKISDRLTCDEFTAAVRQFMGTVFQMPSMGSSFATMKSDEIRQFNELLNTVEQWAKGARRALDTINGEVYDCE